jgi:thioredoxin-dependent peroxiredoxin
MTTLAAFVLITLIVLWLAWHVLRARRHMPMPGVAAPEFELPDQRGVLRSASEFRGRWLALYFYPRDDTPGCTREAACFRDANDELAERGIAVCGVSVDDAATHAKFAAKHALPFTLLADTDGAVAARYGSLVNLGFVRFARRNTFVIDPAGRIAAVHEGVTPATSAERVLRDVAQA